VLFFRMTQPAKIALDHFDRSLGQVLLDIRSSFPTDQALSEAWSTAYYSHSPKNFDALRVVLGATGRFPKEALKLSNMAAELSRLQVARKLEIAAEKSRKADKRKALEKKSRNVTPAGVKLKNIQIGSFEALSKNLAAFRADFVGRTIERWTKALTDFKTTWNNLADAEKGNRGHWIFQHWIAKYVISKFQIASDASDRIVQMAKVSAERDFDSYVVKLAGKIGKPVTSAQVVGDLWNGSTLTVQCKDGESQTWRTKCILNTSPLGNLFNQWPTIRVANRGVS
jgi:hypothetical protein